MKTFPHSPDESVLAARLAADQEKFTAAAAAAQAAAKDPKAFQEASKLAFGLAAMSYAFEKPVAEVKAHAVAATWHAAKAVALDPAVGPHVFEHYLSLSVWTGDRVLRSLLSSWDRTTYSHEDIKADEVEYDVADALAALAKGRADAAASISERGQVRIKRGLVATATLNVTAPLLRVEEALGKSDLMTLRSALGERGTQFTQTASRDGNKNEPEMLLDVLGLALVRIGAEAGLAVETKSVYLPPSV